MAETSTQGSVQATKGNKYLGKYCVASGPNKVSCKNNSSTAGISMHEFPKKGSSLRKSWIQFVQRHRLDWQPSPYSCLCSAHFEVSCFHQRIDINLEGTSAKQSKRLLDRSLAVPTIDTVSSERTLDAVSLRGRRHADRYMNNKYVNNYIHGFINMNFNDLC